MVPVARAVGRHPDHAVAAAAAALVLVVEARGQAGEQHLQGAGDRHRRAVAHALEEWTTSALAAPEDRPLVAPLRLCKEQQVASTVHRWPQFPLASQPSSIWRARESQQGGMGVCKRMEAATGSNAKAKQ